MKKTKKNWLVRILLTLGPALLAISAAQSSFDSLFPGRVPAAVWPWVAVTGAILLMLGGLSWLLIRVPIPDLARTYECNPAKKSELKKIHELSIRYFGEDISPLVKKRKWYKKNKVIYKVMHRVKKTGNVSKRTFVGYYCVIPITEEAASMLESNEIKATGFLSEHIVPEGESPFAFYIGAMAANGTFARGHILTALYNEIRNFWVKQTPLAYTRPVTSRGLRLVKDYDFLPVNAGDEEKVDRLYKREFILDQGSLS